MRDLTLAQCAQQRDALAQVGPGPQRRHILLMAKQLASLRLRRGRQLTAPRDVFNHLQALLEGYEHEVFALLMLDCKHRVIAFHELFRGTLDGASVYPREIVKSPWNTTLLP